MKKLQVPYNLDPDIIDYYCNYKDYIAEVYFAAPPTLFPTARQFSGKNEEEYIQELESRIEELESRIDDLEDRLDDME